MNRSQATKLQKINWRIENIPVLGQKQKTLVAFSVIFLHLVSLHDICIVELYIIIGTIIDK